MERHFREYFFVRKQLNEHCLLCCNLHLWEPTPALSQHWPHTTKTLIYSALVITVLRLMCFSHTAAWYDVYAAWSVRTNLISSMGGQIFNGRSSSLVWPLTRTVWAMEDIWTSCCLAFFFFFLTLLAQGCTLARCPLAHLERMLCPIHTYKLHPEKYTGLLELLFDQFSPFLDNFHYIAMIS